MEKEEIIKAKIKEQLESYGFTEEDLTKEELEELRTEVCEELQSGECTRLDGVLFSIPRYSRAKSENKDNRENAEDNG